MSVIIGFLKSYLCNSFVYFYVRLKLLFPSEPLHFNVKRSNLLLKSLKNTRRNCFLHNWKMLKPINLQNRHRTKKHLRRNRKNVWPRKLSKSIPNSVSNWRIGIWKWNEFLWDCWKWTFEQCLDELITFKKFLKFASEVYYERRKVGSKSRFEPSDPEVTQYSVGLKVISATKWRLLLKTNWILKFLKF